jgi:predicted PurR-regulated permease PerM
MSGWGIFGLILGLVVLALILGNLRDLYRYIKINRM